ncbi:unnamed protein product [Periconia digitata]|uniref:Uncharacterized protein n=1 Tax=Periconia digitata TaxID=1303443 RepID=A0A9W4UV42_9PLEO|nr:unnamed protein product [Periconia digitata]
MTQKQSSLGPLVMKKDSDKERIAPPGPSRYNQSLLSKIQRRLDEASLVQEELAGSRENLLIQREKIRSASNRLSDHRKKTGDVEAQFMNIVRQFYLERREEFPPILHDAYNNVEAARDRLGVMDEEYLQAERTLSGLEWTFMEKENDVYQFELHELFSKLAATDVSSPSASRPPTPTVLHSPDRKQPISTVNVEEQYRMAEAELHYLRERFYHLREEQSKHMDDLEVMPESLMLPDDSPELELLERLMTSEVKVQSLRQLLLSANEPLPPLNRRMSDPMHSKNPTPTAFEDHVTVRTESAVQTLSDNPSTQQKIQNWVYDCLSSTAIQRKFYIDISDDSKRVDFRETQQTPKNTMDGDPGLRKSLDVHEDLAIKQQAAGPDSLIAPDITVQVLHKIEGSKVDMKQQPHQPPADELSPSNATMQSASTAQASPAAIPTFTFGDDPREHYSPDAALETYQPSILSTTALRESPLPESRNGSSLDERASVEGEGSTPGKSKNNTREDSLDPYQQSASLSRSSDVQTSSDRVYHDTSRLGQSAISTSDLPWTTFLAVDRDHPPLRRTRSVRSCSLELTMCDRGNASSHVRAHSTPAISFRQYPV